ncbi:hypothetical protein GCM10010415_64800 [Streptomyces atrovirens]
MVLHRLVVADPAAWIADVPAVLQNLAKPYWAWGGTAPHRAEHPRVGGEDGLRVGPGGLGRVPALSAKELIRGRGVEHAGRMLVRSSVAGC